MKKKYLQLCPWHFGNGASFNYDDFRDFQQKEQHWADSLWLFVWYITILFGLILVGSICLPRRKKAVRAMALLGITDTDVKAALQHLENGTYAYEPTKEEREAWLAHIKKSDAAVREKKIENKPKVMKTWGIVLCAMGGVAGIEGITGLVSGFGMDENLKSMLIGTALFLGVGIYLILRSKKIVSEKRIDGR